MEMLLKISLAFIFYNIVRSERLVVNTTCLELAKPSNQQFRLYCKNASYYHCLLDEYSIKEFEVCMKWKWISKGNCAYFNTYGNGNVDGRQCFNLTNFECPTVVHLSTENMKYPACYVKNTTSTIAPSTSSFQSTFEDTTEGTTKLTIDRKISAAYPISDTPYEQSEKAHMASAIAIGVIIPFLIFSVILCYIYIKGKNCAPNNGESGVWEMIERAEPEENQQQNERRENEENFSLQSQDSENGSSEGAELQDNEQLIESRRVSTIENEGLESSEREKDDSNTEQKPLLNEMKTSSENPPLISEMEKSVTGKGMKGKLNEEQCTETTSDDETLPKHVIEAVSTREAGKTVTT